jgi:hypothetical protein
MEALGFGILEKGEKIKRASVGFSDGMRRGGIHSA